MGDPIQRTSYTATTVTPPADGKVIRLSLIQSVSTTSSGSTERVNRIPNNFTLLKGSRVPTSTHFDTKSPLMILGPTQRRGPAASSFVGTPEPNCSNIFARTITDHRKEWSERHNPWNGQARSSPDNVEIVR